MNADDSARLVAYIKARSVTPRPDCLIWTGATVEGYGHLNVEGSSKRTHRVAWEFEHGEIPNGLTVDHLCRVPACCNTAHMELVTNAENVRREWAVRRTLTARKARYCRNGHEFTPENTLIGSNGKRRCAECRRATERRRRGNRVRSSSS